MATLAQLLAVLQGEKTRSFEKLTEAHHKLQKPALLSGIARSYQPKAEDGDQLPPESTRVQISAESVVAETAEIMTSLFDITACVEWANCTAAADVIVDGQVLLSKVPVTYLLFLDKQLVNLRTFVEKLPTLDPAEKWDYDPNQGAFATKPTQTVRTKKIPQRFVKAEATKEHPAQVDVWHEDVAVGTWSQIKYSGALEADRVKVLMDRIDALQKAVKIARETANAAEAPKVEIGKKFFDHLFAK